MIFRFLESFSNQPMMLMLGVVGLAMIGGGIPPIRERIRRRKIENALPSFLEGLSDEVGAGLGIQEAMQHQAKQLPRRSVRFLKKPSRKVIHHRLTLHCQVLQQRHVHPKFNVLCTCSRPQSNKTLLCKRY